MTITLDEFAEIAALKTARMYFPAKTDAESLEMLRAWTEKTLKSEDLRSVDEQQNSAEGEMKPHLHYKNGLWFCSQSVMSRGEYTWRAKTPAESYWRYMRSLGYMRKSLCL